MAIRDWSGRKLAVVWAIGFALELAVVFGPMLAAFAWVSSPEFERRLELWDTVAARQNLWTQQDSASARRHRADAIRTGQVTVTPAGDTVFAAVTTTHKPSGDFAIGFEASAFALLSFVLWVG